MQQCDDSGGSGDRPHFRVAVARSSTADPSLWVTASSSASAATDNDQGWGGTMKYAPPAVTSVSGPLSPLAPGSFTISGSGFGAAVRSCRPSALVRSTTWSGTR